MNPTILCAGAVIMLYTTTKIPRGLLIILTIAWLVAFSFAAPGTLTIVFHDVADWIGHLATTLPRTPQ